MQPWFRWTLHSNADHSRGRSGLRRSALDSASLTAPCSVGLSVVAAHYWYRTLRAAAPWPFVVSCCSRFDSRSRIAFWRWITRVEAESFSRIPFVAAFVSPKLTCSKPNSYAWGEAPGRRDSFNSSEMRPFLSSYLCRRETPKMRRMPRSDLLDVPAHLRPNDVYIQPCCLLEYQTCLLRQQVVSFKFKFLFFWPLAVAIRLREATSI